MKKKVEKELPKKAPEEVKKEEIQEEEKPVEPKKIEVVYRKAKLGKRMLAHLIDVGSLFILSVLVFVGLHYAFVATPYYQEKTSRLIQVREESGLYMKDHILIEYLESEEGSAEYPSLGARNELLRDRIYKFYDNPTYYPTGLATISYDQRRLDYKTTVGTEQVNIFEKKDEQIVQKEGISDEIFYNFYKSEFENHALPGLVNNITYLRLTQFAFISEIVIIFIAITISFALVYLILPLTAFKRGRQTLGMKANKIGLITVKAVNEGPWVYVGRFFFNFIVFIPLNFVSFLIPSFISLGMMFFSKTSSSITNYVFNDYMVDVDLKKIYLNEAEREYAEEELKKISLENKDLYLK